jgi:hypothetical protein
LKYSSEHAPQSPPPYIGQPAAGSWVKRAGTARKNCRINKKKGMTSPGKQPVDQISLIVPEYQQVERQQTSSVTNRMRLPSYESSCE